MYKILSLNGGGIKSIYTLEILEYIETISGKNIKDSFDLVVGTSAGAFIGVLLDSLPPHYIKKLLISEFKQRLFKKNNFNFFSLFNTKYNTNEKENAIKELLDYKTSFTHFDYGAIAYDIKSNKPFVFNTIHNVETDQYKFIKEFNIVDSVLASSAAPLYWDPFIWNNAILIDGGICANNPSIIGLNLALSKGISLNDICIVNIGTGISTRSYNLIKGDGPFKWLLTLLNILMGSQDLITDSLFANNIIKYFNFDSKLTNGLDDIDIIKDTNINNLLLDASILINTQQHLFKQLIEIL